ncbi:50S ribosomal protein L30 [Enteractinococcus coprophilus]|uniref:Large ribosomal subunit protein uL30 n=1 Tax=Enteractinococcus coprophilus TaxID=1027633 RepID=A0A543A0L4_9MICC|nr:50S ribosomal protein L30 [Enteractinococcus coprophilus]TQL66125.1 LSU ribosomal protein L30P [Enteractinococcus coprophilus]
MANFESTPKNLVPSDATLTITQVRSVIGRKPKHVETLRSLGLRGIGKSVTRNADAATVGMVNAVSHLVKVEEVD